MFWRSKEILSLPEGIGRRALYKSMGYTDYDLDRPIIGIANSWNSIIPGHSNLREVAASVSTGISQAGGTPLEFGIPGVCDGAANGHAGMHYVLPTRDLIAHSIEMVVQSHCMDGLVLLGSCDKIVPGMLMAAARLDIPTIFVPGGPMMGGVCFDNRKSDVTSLNEALGMLKAGKISESEFEALKDKVAPGCGSCAFLGTANTMCCAAEAMGMTLPSAGTAPAVSGQRLQLAQESGRMIMELINKGITARKIINKESIINAIRVILAIGGSTNATLHFPAIAYEAGVNIPIKMFDELSRVTPHIAKVYPSGPANVVDFHEAGGVPAVMKELSRDLNLDCMTVTAGNVGENIETFKSSDKNIISPYDNPFNKEGGLAVLYGNLAPDSAVTKPVAIHPSMWEFTGKAKVFDSEEAANEAILGEKIVEGDVVVIRYEGPKGGPGMREMYSAMKTLYGLGLALKTAVITDGRFSGTNNGCFVGHISPEAAEGGPIAIIENGDRISIDIPNRKLILHVSDEEIKQRLSKWKQPEPKISKGYLSIYSRLAESASSGAIIRY